MRAVEGSRIAKELVARVERIENCVGAIIANADGVVDAYRTEKLHKTRHGIARQKRLWMKRGWHRSRLPGRTQRHHRRDRPAESHLTQLRELLNGGDEIGKKLDSFCGENQPRNNTILSKSAG